MVWRTARRLHEALAGRVLTRCDVRVPRFATADLTGQTVTEAISRGKHLLIRTGAGVTVHTHLRMDGSWRVRPATNVRAVKLDDQHCYLQLPEDAELGPGEAVCFGVSHPCTTFDKWRVIPVVDDDYRVVDAIHTFF